jgi:hypothetical protein
MHNWIDEAMEVLAKWEEDDPDGGDMESLAARIAEALEAAYKQGREDA